LANLPEDDERALQYFAEIGTFVFTRWQQIAADFPTNGEIDEVASDHRWDDCTETDLQAQRQQTEYLIKNALRQGRWTALFQELGTKFDGLTSIVQALSWVFMEALRGFVGTIGIVVFGLIFLWLAPGVVKSVRTAFDEVAPAETRPDREQSPAQYRLVAPMPEPSTPH